MRQQQQQFNIIIIEMFHFDSKYYFITFFSSDLGSGIVSSRFGNDFGRKRSDDAMVMMMFWEEVFEEIIVRNEVRDSTVGIFALKCSKTDIELLRKLGKNVKLVQSI